MPSVFVGGVAGCGKSAIVSALRELGFEAYDTDDHAKWFDRKTGEPVDCGWGNVPKPRRQWYKQHAWLIPMDWVTEVAARGVNSTVFLCGTGRNRLAAMSLCDVAVSLVLNERILLERLAARPAMYGKRRCELEMILREQAKLPKQDKAAGAILLDASLPVKELVTALLLIAGL
jgi:gluconate kinase